MAFILKTDGRMQSLSLTIAFLFLFFGVVTTACSGWLEEGTSIF